MAFGDTSKTGSVCQIEIFNMVHVLEVIGYSLAKEFGSSTIEVGRFDLAGHTWSVRFVPVSSAKSNYQIFEYIQVYLALVTKPKVPMIVSCELSLLNQDGKSSPDATKSGSQIFTEMSSLHRGEFMDIAKLETSEFLRNDSLMIQCSLQVKKPSRREETRQKCLVVPPSDLNQHLGWLLDRKEGADVSFQLNEDIIVAHKNVLAARSPVFRAQFFGSMLESKIDSIKIEEMKPEVFKAMLHFIYTDALPAKENITFEMTQHLFVAADRYGLERLKLICAERFCAGINVETAATTLVLAVRHGCHLLKDFCVDFVASRKMLDAVMASEGFEHLMASCPSVLKEILEKVHSSRGV